MTLRTTRREGRSARTEAEQTPRAHPLSPRAATIGRETKGGAMTEQDRIHPGVPPAATTFRGRLPPWSLS